MFEGLDRDQSGQGIGDFFLGLLRRIIPVARNLGKHRVTALSGAQCEGASFQDSLPVVIRRATQAVTLVPLKK